MFDMKKHRENLIADALAQDKFDPMAEVLSPGELGVAKIDHFEIDPADMIKSMADYQEDFLSMGRYARLRVNGQLMMTDSPMEKRTNLEVVEKARGRVLIAGLGLGMILRTILRKPEVDRVVVLEKYQDVADLVAPSLAQGDSHTFSGIQADDCNHICVAGTKLEIVIADVFQWKPSPTLPKFHVIYFDIWPNSNVRHLPEMYDLHKRYRPLLAKGGWMDSWTFKLLKQKQRDDERFNNIDLPRKLWKTLQTEGGEKLAERAMKMLVAPDEAIDADTKHAVARWLREHHIQLGLKVDGRLTAEQNKIVAERLAVYGVRMVEP